MLIKRKHPWTGVENEQEIPVTEQQLADWKSGTSIQNAMPNLTADQREFIMTGLLPKDWDDLK